MTEFITRDYGQKEFEVIIKTDNKDHYEQAEAFARKLIDHEKQQTECRTNYEAELKDRCAELAEVKKHLSAVLDERAKIGLKFEQALMRIEELNARIKFLEGQIEAYQYCMNCRR